MSANKQPQQLIADMNAYIELQRRRLTLAELGSQLERFSSRLSGPNRYVAFIAAAQAYHFAGDEENELRLLAAIGPENLGGENEKRLFALLLTHRPAQLARLPRTGLFGASKLPTLSLPMAMRRSSIRWSPRAAVCARPCGPKLTTR